jgi:hypothetical protein
MSELLEGRLARQQTLLREVNDRIETMAGNNQAVEFVCECSDADCVSTVMAGIEEYERIRSNSTLFLVHPGHETLEVERVVVQLNGYLVVEKVEGEVAKETDPAFS